MNEANAHAAIQLLWLENVSEAEYTAAERTLLYTNAGPFEISNGHRSIRYDGCVLFVTNTGVRSFPRCATCRGVNEDPRYRGALGMRLCRPCARERTIAINRAHQSARRTTRDPNEPQQAPIALR